MSHHIHVFIAHPEVLRAYADAVPAAQTYRLTPGADRCVLPLGETLLDALHRAYGTGEWIDAPPLMLTTADMAFAASTSRRGPLAYVETDYHGGIGTQAAALWAGGALAIRPLSLAHEQAAGRARTTWPINAVLRALGIAAVTPMDEFDTFGLGRYRSDAAVVAGAMAVRV